MIRDRNFLISDEKMATVYPLSKFVDCWKKDFYFFYFIFYQ